MNRRGFLQRFGIGVTAALALAALPEAVVAHLSTPELAKRCACEYMRTAYNRSRGLNGAPALMWVSPGLYRAYEGELLMNERFRITEDVRDLEGPRWLVFKATRVEVDPQLAKWDIRFVERAA